METSTVPWSHRELDRVRALDASLWDVEASTLRVVLAASVFGATFWRGGVRAVLPDVTEDVVETALRSLRQRAVFTRGAGSRFRGEDTWTFTNATLAEALDGAFPADEHRRAHGRAARWLEAAGELDAAVLAGHLLRAEVPREAAPWCAEAARTAVLSRAWDDALAWSEHAIGLGVDTVTEASLRMLQVSVHDARGALDDAERCAAAAWSLSPRGSMEWFRAAASMAVLAMRRLRPERFRELAPALDEALRNPAAGIAPAGLSSALYPMLQAGQYALADLLLDRLEAILATGEHPEPTFPARVFAARALRASFDGDPARFVEESRRAAMAYEAHDEPRFALLHWNNLAFGQLSLGEVDEAMATCHAVIARASPLDLQRIVNNARHNLGLALLFAGRTDEAIAVEQEAVTTASSLGDAHAAALARLYLARALIASGAPRDALRHTEDALHALSGNPGGRLLTLAVRAQAMLSLGDAAGALRAANEGMTVLAALGTVEEGEGLLRVAHAEALRASGDVAGSRAAVEAARTWLVARARRVGDERARLQMLYGVPEHARIMELAGAS